MANTSGHTLEILIQARDAATSILKATNQVIQEIGKSASDSAKQAGTAFVDMSVQAKQLKVNFDEVASSLAGVGVAFAGLGASLTGIFGLAVKSASDFETAVTGVRAVLQADFGGNVAGLNTTMGQLADKARELGTTTQFSAVQAANAMEELAKAGYKTNDIMASSDAVLKLAAVGQINLAETAERLVNILTPYGLKAADAAKATNTIAVVANETTSGVRDIAEAMVYAAPAAASLKMSVEETAAAIGVLSDNGMKGHMAGVALRGIFIDLVKPTREAREALKNLGVEIVRNNDGSFNAVATLKALRDANMTLADSAAIFGVYQATAALALAQNVDKFAELTEKTRTQTTAIDDFNKTLTNTFSVTMERLISSLKVMSEAIGTPLLAPLKEFVLQLIDGVKWLTDFARAHETLTKYVMGATGVVGGIAVVFGAISLAAAGLIWALGSMRQAWMTLIGVWERGIILSLKAEAATLAESVARQKNAAAAVAEAGAIAKANAAKGGLGGLGETARGALPGLGVAAGIGGAAIASMANWDKDLKGINTSLLDISAVASILPGKFGAIGQAVTAWGSAIAFTVTHWTEISGFLKDDLGIIGQLWTKLVEVAALPFQLAYSAVSGLLRVFGMLKIDIPDATQAQRDFTRASVEMGESWAQFQESYQNTFKTRPPDEIARLFGQLRREVKNAGDAGKQAGTDIATGMTQAAAATRLSAVEQQKLKEKSKEIVEGLKTAFQTLKEQTSGAFSGINTSIKSFEEQWQATSKRTGKASEDAQAAFKAFADQLNTGIGNATAYVTTQMDTLAQRLQQAIDGKALTGELEAMKQGIKSFAEAGIKEFERWAQEADKSIKTLQDEYDKAAQQITQTHQKAEIERTEISDRAESAIRGILRSGMTEREKYLDSISAIQKRQQEADRLIALGGEENYKRASEFLNKNIQDAQQLVGFTGSRAEQERAIQVVKQAQSSLDDASKKREEEQTAELQRQQDAFKTQIDQMAELKSKAEAFVQTLKDRLAVTVDTTAAEEQMNMLFRDREISITANVTATGEGISGMATGGVVPGGYGGGDRFPALLESGEFVVRKEAVRSLGVGMLQSLNAYGSGIASAARSAFSGITLPRFASGGFVDNISTRVADSLDALRTVLDNLIWEMRSLQAQIQQQNMAYAGGGSGNVNWSAVIETMQTTALMNKASAESLADTAGRLAQVSRETQTIQVNVQDGMSSTQTSVDY